MEIKKHKVVGTSLGIDENAKALPRDPSQRDAKVEIPNSEIERNGMDRDE